MKFMNAVQGASFSIRSYNDNLVFCTLTGKGANTKLWHILGIGTNLISAIEKAKDNAEGIIRESLLT